MTRTGEARDRLSLQAYTKLEPGNPLGLLQEALQLAEELEPLEQKLRQAQKERLLKSEYLGEQIEEAASAEIISKDETERMRSYHRKVLDLMAVDDFDPADIGRAAAPVKAASKPVKPAAPVKKKTAGKKKARAKAKKVSKKKKNVS